MIKPEFPSNVGSISSLRSHMYKKRRENIEEERFETKQKENIGCQQESEGGRRPREYMDN